MNSGVFAAKATGVQFDVQNTSATRKKSATPTSAAPNALIVRRMHAALCRLMTLRQGGQRQLRCSLNSASRSWFSLI